MAKHKTKDGVLTEADLATYGILPRQPVDPPLAQSYVTARRKDKIMKPSTEDKAAGKIHEVKGKIREKVGKVTNNPDLEASGEAEKNVGKVQKWVGRVEKAVGE
jgi:uncharacterized protein YjbJ (UPF0337 family)